MHVNRRLILTVTGASMLISLAAWWQRGMTPIPVTAQSQASLRAWIDTLLPAEPDFPGALALGVAERISGTMERAPDYAKLVREALTWVDARTRESGGTAFAELPESRRYNIVAAAAASPLGSTPRTFFQATLDDALFHVYADPRSWTGLGYAGPPQPIGFMDFAAAPKPV